jgi:hypothetical protein
MMSKRRARLERTSPLMPAAVPVMITPKQTPDEIERCRLIRESRHDESAITVKAGRTRKTRA